MFIVQHWFNMSVSDKMFLVENIKLTQFFLFCQVLDPRSACMKKSAWKNLLVETLNWHSFTIFLSSFGSQEWIRGGECAQKENFCEVKEVFDPASGQINWSNKELPSTTRTKKFLNCTSGCMKERVVTWEKVKMKKTLELMRIILWSACVWCLS